MPSAAPALRASVPCPHYDVGEFQGIPYLSLGYIDGKSLAELLSSGKALTVKQMVTLVRKVALALAEAHKKGVSFTAT